MVCFLLLGLLIGGPPAAAQQSSGSIVGTVLDILDRITDAASESINSRIQWVKYTARGFPNKAHLGLVIKCA